MPLRVRIARGLAATSVVAALMGLGNTRRIVLGDTMIDRYTPDEIEVVLAHELGHLLLGTGQHSASGIMQGNWRGKQIVLAAQGLLRFGPGERVRILHNMQLRTLASNSSLSQSADRQRD